MAEYIDRKMALSFPFANGQYDHENANEHFVFGCEAYKEWLQQLPVVEDVTEGDQVKVSKFIPHPDLIRREDAVWVLCKVLCKPGPICPDTLCQEMWDKFKDVPSVPPFTDEEIQKVQDLEQAQFDKMYELGYLDGKNELVHGRWIVHYGNWADVYECDLCHHESKEGGKYCSNCGARMGGDEDE